MKEELIVKREGIIRRLNKIEGQVKGIKKMVEGNICCSDVLVQISAVRAATGKVALKMLELYSESCLDDLESCEDREKVMKELLETLELYMKFGG